MFKIDPQITEKDLMGKSIVKVLISMNSHQVATPETSLEDARSYVFFFSEENHRLSAYIGLHLLLTDRKLFYGNSRNPFKENDLPEVEDAARDFAEYLGAMLDEVDFASMSDLEQGKWIEDQGIFGTKAQPQAEPMTEPQAEPPVEPVTATPEPVVETETGPAVAPGEQDPAPEVAVAAPAPQPPAEPEQPAPAAETTSAPVPPATPVQPVPAQQPPEAQEQPREASVAEMIDQKTVRAQDPPIEAAKRRREVTRKEATPGIEMSPKQTIKKKAFSATGVVSRDREALARLLTSF